MELHSIAEKLEIILEEGQNGRERSFQKAIPRWTKVHVWTDSQVPIARLKHKALGPEQWLARRIIVRAQHLAGQEELRSRFTV